MTPEFDQFPVFYFSNHNAMFGDEEEIEIMPDHFHKLDYELEFAIVIGKGGKNILSKKYHLNSPDKKMFVLSNEPL